MKKIPKRKRRVCELHACLKHILRLCRWSGHFPVEALHNPWGMRFDVKSIYLVYYACTWITLTHSAFACVYRYFFKSDYRFDDMVSVVMFFSAIIVTALMYRLAKHWPALVQDAMDMEQSIAHMVQVPSSTHMKCAVLTYAIVVLGFVEHILYTSFKLQIEVFCSNPKVLSLEVFDRFLKNYFYSPIFDYVPFYRWFGIFSEFVRLQNNFMWNVTDILGMCFSIYLTSYFQELGKIIHSDKPKNWGKIRACYSRLAILLNLINEQLAPFVFLTSMTSLFFICKQLFNSLHKDVSDQKIPECSLHLDEPALGQAYIIYYVFSFLFLIIRSMTFVYLATNVHTSANNAVLPLYEVPSAEYNEEVECFQMQLRYTTVGLSGIFFFIERRTILRVIATIVTYELVLLQLNLPRDPASVDYTANLTMQLFRGVY